MDPATIFAGMVLLLLLAFFAGIPIYVSFLICNLAGLFLLIGPSGLGLFVNSIINTATMSSLVTIPFFILMGDILYRANAVDALVRATDTLIGRLRGRHYVLSIAVSTILATLSGSAMASSAMLCRTVYPVMMSRGYDRRMSLGVILGGACLAPIIPPSVLAIIIATVAEVSIADLFVAGLVPGLLISAMFLVYIFVRVALDPALAPQDVEYRRPSLGQVGHAILQLLPFSLVILMVIGSIMFGIATPTESAAIGILGAMIVAAIFRRLSVAMLMDAVRSTALITAMIMAIIFSSQLFSQLLAFSGAGTALKEMISALPLSPGLMLFCMMVIPFVICMFLDEMAAMMILIPIYIPFLPVLGFDPVWFWTLFLINMTLGAIAPPVGYVLFVMNGILTEVKLTELFAASLPYVLIFIAAMFLMGAFPQIVLFLL